MADRRNQNMMGGTLATASSMRMRESNILTDSIRVCESLCPPYAHIQRQDTEKKLIQESTVSTSGRGLEVLLLVSMLVLITLVSMIDVYWSFKTQAVLSETEQNPLGKWLIDRDGGDISLFMTLKMAGTMAVILTIPVVYFFRRSWGLICASALCIFQCLLLVYFVIGDQLF